MHLYDIEQSLYKENVIFTFSGIVSYNFLTSTSKVIRQDLEATGESSNKKLTNLFAVVTEMFENIKNYSAKKVHIEKKSLGIGTCVIKKHVNNEDFIVSSGNFIKKENASVLKERLDKIISLDKKGIKKLHKEARKSGKDSHNKGAGLGFITIAKKTEHKLKYQLTEVDDTFSYFEIEITI